MNGACGAADAEEGYSAEFLTFLNTPHPHTEDKPLLSEITEVAPTPKDIFLPSVTFHFVKT